jgi:hypothetical protein
MTQAIERRKNSFLSYGRQSACESNFAPKGSHRSELIWTRVSACDNIRLNWQYLDSRDAPGYIGRIYQCLIRL